MNKFSLEQRLIFNIEKYELLNKSLRPDMF